MTRYLVTDDNIRCAIHEAIECQDKDPQGDNYVIASSADVVNHVLRIFDKVRVAKTIKTLIEVDEDDCHELSDEPRFSEQYIALAFLLGIITSSTLSDMINPRLVGEVAIKIATDLGLFTQED